MPPVPHDKRWWIYPLTLGGFLAFWTAAMAFPGRWDLFVEAWPAAATMTAGSFIAGATPVGGGAVAFPVFTKVLGIDAPVARTFSLMIQSVGMSMASLFIITRGMAVSWRAIRLGVAGGIPGLLVGLLCLAPPDPYPRLLFTVVMVVFGAAVIVSHWVIRWSPCPETAELPADHGGHWHLLALGFLGGCVSSLVGSGIDLLLFMGLTLAMGLHERHAIPTTVITMAAISVAATAVLVLRGDPGVAAALPYWWASAPVVACGAPLGAWVASRAPRDVIVIVLLALIALEAVTTSTLVGWNRTTLGLGTVVGVIAAIYFGWMLRRRHAALR